MVEIKIKNPNTGQFEDLAIQAINTLLADAEGRYNATDVEKALQEVMNKIPDLSGYATQSFVSNAIAQAQIGEGGEVDLSGYVTSEQLSTAINNIVDNDTIYDDTDIRKLINDHINDENAHNPSNIGTGDKPKWFLDLAEEGAVYNNPTHDNKPLLESTTQILSDYGGGILFIPDKGDLYVSENIKFAENVKVIGPKSIATIKLMPTIFDFWSMVHLDNRKDLKIKNLIFDTNRDVRETNGTLGDLTGNNPQMIVSLGDSTENIKIENCEFYGNGTWMLAAFSGGIHPKNIKIKDSYFYWKMGVATPDKPFYEGVTIDNTLIYFDAVNYEFTGNTVETDTGYANMTGIEVHGADALVKHNTFRGVRTGSIIWNLVNEQYPGRNNNLNVSENKFLNVLNGVDFGMSPGRNLTNVKFEDNIITLKPSAFPKTNFSRGIILGAWNAITGEIAKNVSIMRNRISSEDYDIYGNDPYGYHNHYGIGVISGVYENLMIKDNIIENLPSFGIYVQNEYQKTLSITSGIIKDNIIKNVAKGTKLRTIDVDAMFVSSRADTDTTGLIVGENYVYDTNSSGTHFSKPATLPIGTNFKQPTVISTAGGGSNGFVVTGIGDSIMWGRLDTGTNRMATPWLTTVAINIGADSINNLGISGSLIATKPRNAVVPVTERLSSVPANSDVIFAQGATNDYASGVVMGSINDTTTETFYGALNAYYGGLKSTHPNARIIVITMPATTAVRPASWTQLDYVDAQIAVAKKYGLEVFDAHRLSMITPDLADMADGVHMSQADANIFAQEITDFYNGTFVSDRDGEVTEPVTGTLVWDSSTDGYTTTQTNSNYLRTQTIKLKANTKYVVETTMPKHLNNQSVLESSVFASNTASDYDQIYMDPDTQYSLTTTVSGDVLITTRPVTDPDGKGWTYNDTHIKNGTYKVTIKEVV